jgi:flagellar protein FlaG
MTVIHNDTDIGLSGLNAGLNTDLKANVNSLDKTDETKKNEIIKVEKIVPQEVVEVQENKPLSSKQLEKVAQQLQEFVGELNKNLQFSVDKDSGRDVIKVFDRNTGDLLKQFPSEEVLTLVSKLSEMVGGLVDAKA